MSVQALMLNVRGDNLVVQFDVNVFDDVTVVRQFRLMTESLAGPPVTFDRDTLDRDAIVIGSTGKPMTVQFSNNAVNVYETLLIKGYDL